MKLHYLLPILFACLPLTGQTVLGPGDAAFTLINMDGTNTDAFAFVLLKDVDPTTKIVVTDDEVSNGSLFALNQEGRIEITFDNAFPCGTVIYVQDSDPDISTYAFQASTGPGNTTGLSTTNVGAEDHSLGTTGETLIAFQDPNPNTNTPVRYITALANTGVGFGVAATGSSELPTGLVLGTSALALPGAGGDEIDNYKLNCNNPNLVTTGTPSQIAASVYTASNWISDNDNPFPVDGCNYTCLATCTDPTLTSVTASPPSSCPGTPVTLTISGSLGDAAGWRLHEGTCSGPIIDNTTGSTFTVNPAGTTTYFVSVLDCDVEPICVSTVVTRSVQSANAGTDQLLIAGTSTNLAANSSGAGDGMWTVISGDGNGVFSNASSPTAGFTGTAGQSYVLRWTISGGGCPTTTDEVEVSFGQPATDLAAGDLAFIGYNSDAPDEFSFIVLREISAGTQVFFTDMGWLLSGGFRTSAEGLILFTFDRNYSCGDAFYLTQASGSWEAFDENGNSAGPITIPASPSRTLDIGTTGDQLFAFQGSLGSPTLLAGIHVASAWSDAINNSSSAQPATLTGNNTSVNIAQDVNNGIYNCSVTSGPPANLLTAINDASNWDTSDNLIALTPTCNFDCQDCIEPNISSLRLTPNPVCAGQAVTITITGDLNGANRWVVYAPGDCGGTELATSTSNDIVFTPNGGGTYLVAGVDGCVASPTCSSAPIMQTGAPAAITMDQPTTKVSGTSVALTAAALDGGQTGTWSILSGSDNSGSITDPSGPGATLTGTAGGGYLLQYSVTGNGCPQTTDEVSVSFLIDNGVSFGGMAFTGYNSNPTDNFSVVVLESLTAGTSFSVTDNGWLAAGGFRPGEETANYLLCRPLTCGDNIRFEPDGNGYASDGTVVAELQLGSTFPSMSSSGDQLFLYSGFAAPTAGDQTGFVAAIQMNCENGSCSEANWDSDATDSGSSGKPSAFATGGSVFGGTAPADNGRYNCSNGTSNVMDLFVLVNTDANWSFQNGAFTLNGCGFSCDPAPVAVCQDITVEIDADGNPTTNGQPFMASELDGGSTDNGSIDPNGFSVDITPGCANVTAPPSATTVTLTVTDDLGQTATCTSQVTVEDNIAPTFTCTNITVDLNAAGEYFISNDDVLLRMVQNWSDNCAPAPVNFGSGTRTITCDNTTNGTFSYFFGAIDGNGQEALCTATITVNDPTLFCDDAPVAMCQDFQTFIAAGETAYTVNASDFDNGSTDDNGIAGFVFSDQVSTIASPGLGGNFPVDGLGQVIKADQSGFIRSIRLKFGVASSNRTIHLYNSNNGSGVTGIGTPAYSQSGIELVDGTGGTFTEIRLTTPFPVTEGQFYSFVMEGTTSALYGFDDTYTDGQFLAGYNLNSQPTIDLAFEVDFLGSSTQEFMAGTHPVTIFAVDNAGQLSTGCDATFTLDAACTPGTFTETPIPAVDGYCAQENVTLAALATLNDSEDIFWYMGNCATLGAQIGTGTSVSFQFPADGQDMTVVCVIQGPDGCGDGACVTTTLLHETVPPTLFTIDITKELDGDGNATLLPNEVFDVANSFDDCVNGSRSLANGVTATSVIPNTFTMADIGPNTVTLTATDESGNTTTETAVVTIVEAALPVEWLFFGADAGAKTVDLQWETTTEPDNAGFHIERSPDGRAWSVLAEQAPLASNAYRYTDATPLTGDNYYRIRQTDFDGTVTYSPVEVVTFTGDIADLTVAPNPATDEFTVLLSAKFGEAAQFQLLDMNGRAVQLSSELTQSGIRFATGLLPRGVYLVRAVSGDGKMVKTAKVVLH
jgi:hypothetical protein